MKHEELVHLLKTKYCLSVNDQVRDRCEFNLDKEYLAKDCKCFASWFIDSNNNVVWVLRNEVIRNYNPDAMEANVSSDNFLQDSWYEINGEIDITEEDIDLRWQMLNKFSVFLYVLLQTDRYGSF